MGAQALDHTSSFVVKVMEQILGLDFLVIPGYPGTPEILLDIERGALDGRSQGTGSLMATKREWLKNGYIKPLVTSRRTRDRRLPNVPSIEDSRPPEPQVCWAPLEPRKISVARSRCRREFRPIE